MAATIVNLRIITAPVLADPFADHLIGIHGAAVECGVVDGGGPLLLQAFVEIDPAAAGAAEALAEQVRNYGAELAGIFSCPPPEVTVELVQSEDWAENWKVHFKPFAIVPGLVIAPTWERYQAREDERVVVMDPGMAFGTGHHETTRLCLEMLREAPMIGGGGTMLDVGTGTGILGMAALCFGAGRVVAVDNDPEAVRVARENCRRNGLDGRMEVAATDLGEIDEEFDLVVANIVHDTILELSAQLRRLTRAGGSLLLSGLLDGEQGASVTSRFQELGLGPAEKRTDGQWCALLLAKPPSPGA